MNYQNPTITHHLLEVFEYAETDTGTFEEHSSAFCGPQNSARPARVKKLVRLHHDLLLSPGSFLQHRELEWKVVQEEIDHMCNQFQKIFISYPAQFAQNTVIIVAGGFDWRYQRLCGILSIQVIKLYHFAPSFQCKRRR
ncbi:hypothetical protein AVEN_80287-1 [Araneus ventricosus]|uniref:Uncharacterized protein n=1 Tax=Araneus ventricosus TaxID=182803 RepID=A0A4Y2T064_ARAVE|nr:hypothetical protein AVEN_89810-1 [Araneus ventricosus]GBN93982.1 hypothetical protein AVEN_80287-1 [Araneus ventricosus]